CLRSCSRQASTSVASPLISCSRSSTFRLAVHRWKSFSIRPPSELGSYTLSSLGGEPPQTHPRRDGGGLRLARLGTDRGSTAAGAPAMQRARPWEGRDDGGPVVAITGES